MLIKLILTEAAYIPLKDLPVYDISEHLWHFLINCLGIESS
jgi:hypothetical protein